MENEKNNKGWIWAGVAVLLVLVIWLIANRQGGEKATLEDDVMEKSELTDDSKMEGKMMPKGTEDTSAKSVNAEATVYTISYDEALEKYKGARLELDRACQATPDKMTFKNGSYLMIDNRSPLERTVRMDTTFTIKGYGFKVVKLESAFLPATWLVSCADGTNVSQNTATITIQQ